MHYIYNSINFNTIKFDGKLKSKIKIPYEKKSNFFTKYIKYITKNFKHIEQHDNENDILIVKINPGWSKQY